MKAIITSIFLLFGFSLIYGQDESILVFDGAFINIHNAANIVIDNPHDAAIQRTVNGGHIISEGENNNVRWNIGAEAGNYLVPFGFGTTHLLPLAFSTYGGAGNGYIEMATYGGSDWENSTYLPTGISNFHGFSGPDNSAYAMDRFWKIKARGYNSGNNDKPNFGSLMFGYRLEELQPDNTIRENEVMVQRYNPDLDSWYDFLPGGGNAAVDNVNRTVTIPLGVHKEQIYDWWVIVDKISPLPVELLGFTAEAVENAVHLQWKTTSEKNSEKFIVERSVDGENWEYVFEVAAQGFSTNEQSYEGIDENPYFGYSYYRLKQLDSDGTYNYSPIRQVYFEGAGQDAVTFYPNPTQNLVYVKTSQNFQNKGTLKVFDIQGKLLLKKDIFPDMGRIIPVNIEKLPQGTYLFRIEQSNALSNSYKVVKL